MSNLKKVLALALACVMAFSLSISGLAYTYSDDKTIDDSYDEAINMMYELNIMRGFTNNTFRPEDNLTRAQLVKMLYVIYNRGTDDLAVLQKNATGIAFTDIGNDWHKGYCNWAAINKIIEGHSPTRFAPDDNVTGYEALKMLLVAMGYQSAREGFTGTNWHLNVLKVATDAGLMEDVNVTDLNQPLSRQAAAQMLYNAIFGSMVDYDTTRDPAVAQKVYQDSDKTIVQTLAHKYFGLTTVTGVLVSNGIYSLDSAEFADTDESVIATDELNSDGNMEFVHVPGNADLSLIGKTVTAYVKLDKLSGDDYSVKKLYGSVIEPKGENKVNTVFDQDPSDASDIQAFINDDINSKYTFNNTLYVVDYAAPVNAAAAIGLTVPMGSRIDIIENNNDKDVDFVFITTYEYLNVEDIDDETAYFEPAVDDTGSAMDADLEAILNGDSLKVNDRVLMSAISDPLGDIEYLFTAVPSAKATLTGNRGDNKTVILSGNDYTASGIAGALQNIKFAAAAENYGAELTYYLYNGYVLEHVAKDSSDAQYGIILDVDEDQNVLFGDDKIYVKIFTEAGETLTKLLDTLYDVPGAGNDDFDEDDEDATPTVGEIKNVEGGDLTVIYKFRLVGDDAIELQPTTAEASEGGGVTYNGTSSKITVDGKTFHMDSKSVLFVIVDDGGDADPYVFIGQTLPEIKSTNGGAAAIMNKDDLFSSFNKITQGYLRVAAADIKLNNIDTYALVTSEPDVKYNTTTKKWYATFDIWDGSATKSVTMVDGLSAAGKDKLTSGSSALGIARWDLIEYATDANGKISDVTKARSIDDITGIDASTDGAYATYLHGYQSRMLHTFSDATALDGKFVRDIFDLASDAKIYKVNTDNKTVSVASASNLSVAKDIKSYLIYAIWDQEDAQVTELYLFENKTKDAAATAALSCSAADAQALQDAKDADDLAIASAITTFKGAMSGTGAVATPFLNSVAGSLSGAVNGNIQSMPALSTTIGTATVSYAITGGTAQATATLTGTTWGGTANNGETVIVKAHFTCGTGDAVDVYAQYTLNA